jgi:hypothetical protein
MARFANPFVAAERGYIDEVIMPHGTRKRVARALQSCATRRSRTPGRSTTTNPAVTVDGRLYASGATVISRSFPHRKGGEPFGPPPR